MSPEGVVAVLFGVGAVSWLLRVTAITVLPAARLPLAARRLLDHAAPAALAAVVGAGIAGGVPVADLGLRGPVVIGALVTAVLAWWRRGLVLPVVVGLAVAALAAAW